MCFMVVLVESLSLLVSQSDGMVSLPHWVFTAGDMTVAWCQSELSSLPSPSNCTASSHSQVTPTLSTALEVMQTLDNINHSSGLSSHWPHSSIFNKFSSILMSFLGIFSKSPPSSAQNYQCFSQHKFQISPLPFP